MIVCLHAILLAGIFYLVLSEEKKEFSLQQLVPPQTSAMLQANDWPAQLQKLKANIWWEDLMLTAEGETLEQLLQEWEAGHDSTAAQKTVLLFLQPQKPVEWAVIQSQTFSRQSSTKTEVNRFQGVDILESESSKGKISSFQLGEYWVKTSHAFLAELMVRTALGQGAKPEAGFAEDLFNDSSIEKRDAWIALNLSQLTNEKWLATLVSDWPERNQNSIKLAPKIIFSSSEDRQTEFTSTFFTGKTILPLLEGYRLSSGFSGWLSNFRRKEPLVDSLQDSKTPTLSFQYHEKEEISVKSVSSRPVWKSELGRIMKNWQVQFSTETEKQWWLNMTFSDYEIEELKGSSYWLQTLSPTKRIVCSANAPSVDTLQLPTGFAEKRKLWFQTEGKISLLALENGNLKASFWKQDAYSRSFREQWTQTRSWGNMLYHQVLLNKGKELFLLVSAEGVVFLFDTNGQMQPSFPVDFGEEFMAAFFSQNVVLLATRGNELIKLSLSPEVLDRVALSGELPQKVQFCADHKQSETKLVSFLKNEVEVFSTNGELEWKGKFSPKAPQKAQLYSVGDLPTMLLLTDEKTADTYLIDLKSGEQFWEIFSPNQSFLYPLPTDSNQNDVRFLGRNKNTHYLHAVKFH